MELLYLRMIGLGLFSLNNDCIRVVICLANMKHILITKFPEFLDPSSVFDLYTDIHINTISLILQNGKLIIGSSSLLR